MFEACGAGPPDEFAPFVGRVGLPFQWVMLTPVASPRVCIAVEACDALDKAGRWRVVWRISNISAEPLHIDEAWAPHGRFRGDGRSVVHLDVPPRESRQLALPVRTAEPPFTVVENAFLILRTPTSRIFARMRIEFDADARPRPIVENVTLQSLQ